MSDNIIKEIISTQAGEENNENPQYDTFQIGADAQNIDFPNGQNLLEIIGNITENEYISSGLLDRVSTNENWIEILKQYYNDLNLNTEGLMNSDAIQDENINNIQSELNILSTEIAKITMPYLVDKIIWDTANQRTLRAILGNLENIPYKSVREWLEILTNELKYFNSLKWHSLGEDYNQNEPEIPERTVGKFVPNIIKTYTPNIYQINFDTQIQHGKMYIQNISTENTSGAYNGAAYIYTIPSNEIPYSTFNDNTGTYDFISDDLIGIYIKPSIELNEQDLLWIGQGTQPLVGGTVNSLSGAGYQLHPISTNNGITYLLPQTFFITQRLQDTDGNDIKINIICKKRENNTMFFSENEIIVFKISKSNGFFNLENNFNFNKTFNLYNKQFKNGLSFLCQAKQPNDYEEWYSGISYPLKQFIYPDFTSHSANLIPITQETARTNLFNAAYCDIEGNASFYTPVTPNTTYTISGTLYGQNPYNENDNNINLIINIEEFENIISPSILPEDFTYYDDNNITIDISSQIGTTNIFSYTFTTGANTHYIIIKRFNSDNGYFAFGKIMLNEGSTPLSYAPYIEEGADTLLDMPEEEDFIPINLILNSD